MSARCYTRFIPGEEIAEVRHWQFDCVQGIAALAPQATAEPPSQDDAALDLAADADTAEEAPDTQAAPAPCTAVITEAEHLALLAQSSQTSYERGLAQGQAQAQVQWQQRMDEHLANQGRESAQQLTALLHSMHVGLQEAQQALAGQVLQLACDIARQVLRREVSGNPRALLPVVREALDMLVQEGRATTVRLNPGDWAVLEQPLRAECGAARVQWVADAAIAPGACRVESAAAVVDASLERRWQRAIAALGLTALWQSDKNEGHANE